MQENKIIKQNEAIFTIAEVSKILKTNIDYIHKLRKAGLLKCLKLGSYKIRAETLSEFLKKYEGYDLTDPYHVTELLNID